VILNGLQERSIQNRLGIEVVMITEVIQKLIIQHLQDVMIYDQGGDYQV
jgi:hypothetical protein